MLTSAQAITAPDDLEAAVKTALVADAWFGTGGTGGIVTVEQKVVEPTEETWWDALLPALVVGVAPSRPGSSGTHGAYTRQLACTIEYLVVQGDARAALQAIGAVQERLIRWVHDQYFTAGKRFNGYLDTANGIVLNIEPYEADVVESFNENTAFLFAGGVTFGVMVRAAT